jgi:nitrous oxide reductase accessory protein NosL
MFLAGAGSVCTTVTMGCLGSLVSGSSSGPPEPVSLSGQKLDDQGGMVIGQHGGPNGQIFYQNESPEGHENPAWFHTLSYGLFPYYFTRQNRGWTAEAIYVTDYSLVEDPISNQGDTPRIVAPTAPETFGDAKQLTYVVGSDVPGGMGPDLIPFSDSADVDSFVSSYGGRTMTFDDVTPQWLSQYTG